MWNETGKGEEKVRGNTSEMKIIGWFCSLTQQQWSSVNVAADHGPYVKALIDSVREEGKYDGKRSAQEPGNKEFDMDIRLYLSLNQARNDQPRLQGQ